MLAFELLQNPLHRPHRGLGSLCPEQDSSGHLGSFLKPRSGASIAACYHFLIKGFEGIQNLIIATNAIKVRDSEDQKS